MEKDYLIKCDNKCEIIEGENYLRVEGYKTYITNGFTLETKDVKTLIVNDIVYLYAGEIEAEHKIYKISTISKIKSDFSITAYRYCCKDN